MVSLVTHNTPPIYLINTFCPILPTTIANNTAVGVSGSLSEVSENIFYLSLCRSFGALMV